ncbi:hypothetical protein An18g02570 [Aspergillus niger]|uniref:Uncharacterized protein n=2 Tax=Aspergillus niger TaxID=5061 RepID=A2RAB4_ASPNC|nr:hypothetical protein An18g02570 [Aspergillus niger]CAK43186.1 hypothetical protein An18g02570 [Aspergillus niger]
MARYIMPLKDEQRLPEGAPAIAASFAEFQYQFEAFTHGKGALDAPEIHSETVNMLTDIARLVESCAVEEAVVRKNQRLDPGEALCLRIKNTVTFIAPRWPFRHIQVGVGSSVLALAPILGGLTALSMGILGPIPH